MEQLNLPFRLGMDYEELEFDLEILPDRVKGYDSYIYLGKFNNFLNYTTDKIELLFRMDVLEGVVISYDNLPFIASEEVIVKLENVLGNPQIVNEQYYKLHKFNYSENYQICCYSSKNVTLIVLSIPSIILRVLHSF
ncbi:hypothetical protein GWA97_04580 [Flavobacterium sp. LaA7.5]|nr:hypothetical protein [Flavobacterium salilacus subsp. altitudinum]